MLRICSQKPPETVVELLERINQDSTLPVQGQITAIQGIRRLQRHSVDNSVLIKKLLGVDLFDLLSCLEEFAYVMPCQQNLKENSAGFRVVKCR